MSFFLMLLACLFFADYRKKFHAIKNFNTQENSKVN